MSVGEQDIEVTDDQGNESPRKSMTIGAVCKALEQEFPDISISKIRYLEDQKLLSPRRTPGGYRLYSQSDVARLRTILRLQRSRRVAARRRSRRPASRPGGAHRSRSRSAGRSTRSTTCWRRRRQRRRSWPSSRTSA